MIRSVSIGLLAYAVSGCFVHAAQPEYFGKWIEDDSTCDKSDTATGLSVGAIEFTEGRRIHFEGSCTITKAEQSGHSWELDGNCSPHLASA